VSITKSPSTAVAPPSASPPRVPSIFHCSEAAISSIFLHISCASRRSSRTARTASDAVKPFVPRKIHHVSFYRMSFPRHGAARRRIWFIGWWLMSCDQSARENQGYTFNLATSGRRARENQARLLRPLREDEALQHAVCRDVKSLGRPSSLRHVPRATARPSDTSCRSTNIYKLRASC